MKSGGAQVSTSYYLNPSLLYTMHTLRFHMILRHDRQNPLTTSNYILYAPKPSCNIQHAKIHEITMTWEREKLLYNMIVLQLHERGQTELSQNARLRTFAEMNPARRQKLMQ